MAKCVYCGGEIQPTTTVCPSCGKPTGPDAAETLAGDTPILPPRARSSTPPSRPPSSASRHARYEGRFLPGTLVAGRYRVIALLGRGGMGEVYRADDLSLGQEVALKFLPESTTDEETLERFRNEVRIARRISHPNVCRVFDIGQTDDQVFLSMEYVDGEDLGSLLRRIGRLPGDKAAEIARKICAGVAAAHVKGVLHRDLKPANIMLDGRGEILIMDFGLAGLAHEIEDYRSGTPAYMAPEQLAGEEVTAKSDIYSLGLVLYEVFTGKAAFDGRTLEEIVRVRSDSTPSRPTELVKDLDPAVEGIILRCLENEPAKRPESALAVAAALPGGDPLAAALAAGHTPSPQVVAAAGENVGLSPRAAILWLSAAISGLIAFYALAVWTSGIHQMDLPYSPEVLSQKAHDLAQQFGYAAAIDSAEGFAYDSDYLEALNSQRKSRVDWNSVLKGRPSVLRFWRRESPAYLFATEPKEITLLPGLVDETDPAPTMSGMVEITVDPQGRLMKLAAIPPQLEKSLDGDSALPDWKALFSAAGLDLLQFHTSQPTWNSLGSADNRVAWTGVYPGTSTPLRVEAGAWHGKPIYFELIGDWTKPSRIPPLNDSITRKIIQIGLSIVGVTLLLAAMLLARRHFVRGKADVEGASKLAVLLFCLQMILWGFIAHLLPTVGSFGLFMMAIASALFVSTVVCALYLALEPFVRRHWPHAIISWSRAMSDKVRDPLVGRDLLFGVLFGLAWSIIFEFTFLTRMRLGDAPEMASTDFLLGTRHVIATWLWHLSNSVQATLVFFFLMFILRVILRKPWLAATAFVAFWVAIKLDGSHHFAADFAGYLGIYLLAAFMIVRFGFITLAAAILTVDLLLSIPMGLNPASWYMSGSLFVLTTVAAMAVWGAYTALGGQKILKEQLFE
jgi:predicted Ser/Thr protein kinase